MNRILIIALTSLALSQSAFSETQLIAGWDFSKIQSLAEEANKYEAEYGISSRAKDRDRPSRILLSEDPNVQYFFAANGAAATSKAAEFSLDSKNSVLLGRPESGQQSLNFRTKSGEAQICLEFPPSIRVKVSADWLTSKTQGPIDILNISYTSDGGLTWVGYDKSGPETGYVALADTNAWTNSDGSFAGFISVVSKQNDMLIDLSTATKEHPINGVRFEFMNLHADERVGLDNIIITGKLALN